MDPTAAKKYPIPVKYPSLGLYLDSWLIWRTKQTTTTAGTESILSKPPLDCII